MGRLTKSGRWDKRFKRTSSSSGVTEFVFAHYILYWMVFGLIWAIPMVLLGGLDMFFFDGSIFFNFAFDTAFLQNNFIKYYTIVYIILIVVFRKNFKNNINNSLNKDPLDG